MAFTFHLQKEMMLLVLYLNLFIEEALPSAIEVIWQKLILLFRSK